MEKRRFGRTEHMSTVAIFGGFALSEATPKETDQIMDMITSAGVNHIDIAPSYGHAEARLGQWFKHQKMREKFFLGCKTMERTREGATHELHQSLERLNTTFFDLYQIHAITTISELDMATQTGGALDAMVDARDRGLIRYIGITGHGFDAPAIFLEALRRFDFDTILFPLNFIQYSYPDFRRNADELIRVCNSLDVGTMIIKSIARGPWGDQPQTYITWYQPFTTEELIQQAVNFVLSKDITGICTVGDPTILPQVLHACENFTRTTSDQEEGLITYGNTLEPLFKTAQ